MNMNFYELIKSNNITLKSNYKYLLFKDLCRGSFQGLAALRFNLLRKTGGSGKIFFGFTYISYWYFWICGRINVRCHGVESRFSQMKKGNLAC